MANFECAKCSNTFGSLTDFDRHQIADYSAPREQIITCRQPADLGLINDNGVWRTVAGAAKATRSRQQLADLRSPETIWPPGMGSV
jgi:hypothetical protein